MAETATKDSSQELVSLTDQQVEQALRGELEANEVSLTIEDPKVIQRQIIERILASPDAETVLGGSKAIGGREILGRPFELREVRWLKSRFDEGLPVFAVLDVEMLDDGEKLAVTSSSGNVMAQAYQLKRLNNLPIKLKIEEAEQATAAGFRPQWLVAA